MRVGDVGNVNRTECVLFAIETWILGRLAKLLDFLVYDAQQLRRFAVQLSLIWSQIILLLHDIIHQSQSFIKVTLLSK